jgi:hypothetical protein
MVNFERFTLSNGLKLLVHPDRSTPMAVVNVLYDVGARDENPAQTGFAHLFEHLMFGGSVNIPDYDDPLQNAGGENNAYTTNDLTNYYCQLPAENIETREHKVVRTWNAKILREAVVTEMLRIIRESSPDQRDGVAARRKIVHGVDDFPRRGRLHANSAAVFAVRVEIPNDILLPPVAASALFNTDRRPCLGDHTWVLNP